MQKILDLFREPDLKKKISIRQAAAKEGLPSYTSIQRTLKVGRIFVRNGLTNPL